MRPELETYHQIDSYLNGKLEGEALRSFEHKLQSDPAFAEEVSFQQLTNEIVVGASYDDLRSQMTKDIDKIDAADTTKSWSLYTVAAFILITGAASIYYYSNKTSSIKPANTKETQLTAPSAVSSKAAVTDHSTDSKTVASQKDIQTGKPATIPNTITGGVTDTQSESAVTAPAPQIQVPASAQTTTVPDNKTTQPAEQVIKTTKEPCNINAYISVSPACLNESTGSIRVGGLTGGTAPIHVTIPELSASAKSGGFTYLKAGTYTVRIEDANGCVKVYPTEVTEKSCRKTSYVFAPDKGETWKISGAGDEHYTITLINIAGTQVYKSHLMQGEFEWQGIGQQGEYLSAGLYIYVIEYTNGQKENGQVTIVR